MSWLLAEFANESNAGEKRRGVRRRLRFESLLKGARAPSKVVVLNLSEAGMMLHATEELAVGETFEVALADGAAVEACVVWKRTPLYGCRFVSPVTRGMISAVLLRAEPGPPPDPTGMTTKR
jgi:hypothetical protein